MSLMTLGLLWDQSVLVVYVAPPGDMHAEVVIVQPVMDFEKETLPPNDVLHFAEGDQQGGCQVRSLAWMVNQAMKVFAYICVVLRSQ